MIHHAWSVLCSRSSIDNESNVISLFDVIEEVNVQGAIDAPGVIPGPFDLISLWSRDKPDAPAQGEARWTLITPSGSPSIQNTVSVDLTQYQRLRSRARLSGIPIDAPGQYWFKCELQQPGSAEWVEVARLPLQVKSGATK
jgi:hypothetical protein